MEQQQKFIDMEQGACSEDARQLLGETSLDINALSSYNLAKLKNLKEGLEKTVSDEKFLMENVNSNNIKECIACLCQIEKKEIFEKLFSWNHIKLPPQMVILYILIKELDKDLFEDWFEILNKFEKIDFVEDSKTTKLLLETAIRLDKNTAVIELCKAGAYIGYKFKNYKEKKKISSYYLIDEMPKEVVKKIFNACITSNGENAKASTLEIYFNYSIFVPPKNEVKADEMTTIGRILNSEEFSEQLKHPLITSFMTIKWQNISRIFYLNYILYCIYGLSMISYILLKINYCGNPNVSYLDTTWYISILGILYLIIREAIQFFKSEGYLKQPSNYFEIVLVALSIWTITTDINNANSKIIVVATILLMAWELCTLVGYLPFFSISTHMLMLEEVLKTFLKSFSVYSIFLFTFVLCFHVIDTTNQFTGIMSSFTKTVAMVVGELDFENFKKGGIYNHAVFLLFVLCMTVVLMNLLNGLAVSDIQLIKNKAELNELICRAKLLNKSNLKLLANKENTKVGKNKTNKKNCYCRYILTVYPNEENFPNRATFPSECEICKTEEETPKERSFWRSFFYNEHLVTLLDALYGKCTVMSSSIVKSAKKKVSNFMVGDEKSESEEKLDNIEDNIKFIKTSLEKIEDYLSKKKIK